MSSIFGKKKAKLPKPQPKPEPRQVEEIEKDLGMTSAEIGQMHHQKVVLEHQISQKTNHMHGLLMELNDAKERDKNLERLMAAAQSKSQDQNLDKATQC